MSTSTTARLFAPITKREKDPATGHLYVYGKMTGPDLDSDLQRMDPEWLKTAVPDWFKRGNIREMHQPHAAGKAVELTEQPDGWYVGAKIVDRGSIEKVEEGVLTGFSIRVRNPQLDYSDPTAPAGLNRGGRITECSLVDVPALPTCRLTLAKGDDLEPVDEPQLEEDPDDEDDDGAVDDVAKADSNRINAADRKQMANSGVAMDNGDFPIPDETHLHAAIRLLGRYEGDKAAAKAHIIARAKAMGLESALPDDWDGDEDMGKVDALTTLRAILPELIKLAGGENNATAPDLTKVDSSAVTAIVNTAVANAVKSSEDRLRVVEEQLTKALALPQTGGPVSMRTASQTAAARAVDALTMRAQADVLLAKADAVQRDDPTLAQGYRDRAAELTKAAA